MTRTIGKILTPAFCLISIIAYCVSSQNKTNFQEVNFQATDTLYFDTSKTAIIPLLRKSNYPFDNSYRAASLNQQDITNIDSLLIISVVDFNNSLSEDSQRWSIDLKENNYRKQLVVAMNNKGEKEVWVNCFCDSFYKYWRNTWKSEIVMVMDGAQCYFQFKINLTTKKVYEFRVNSTA